ncbi:hypothetical protein KC953_02555 [Candidatus Saccharibacteria bacterium]|nr:hypothetical protein [Candidatus Saccharibacteria bacterium]
MADKRKVRRSIRQLQYLKTWQLLVLLLLVGFIAATFLRLNNIGMLQRRTAVLQADETGDKEAIKSRLFELQRYVTAHMNADMGTIYLEGQYHRDTQQAIDGASSGSNPNGNIYKKAQEVCAPKFTHYTYAYLQCTLNYLSQFGPADNPTSTVRLPKADAYRYSFVSPLWSADFAGFSVLFFIFITLVIIARLLVLSLLKAMLKMHNRDA